MQPRFYPMLRKHFIDDRMASVVTANYDMGFSEKSPLAKPSVDTRMVFAARQT